MKKVITTIFIFLLFASAAGNVKASIVVVNPDGEVTWNVLSEDTSNLDIPKHSYIEVKEIADTKATGVSRVSLEKEESGKISLVVSSDKEDRKLDVSGVKQELVEIEERPTSQKLTLGIDGDKFTLFQKNVKALTEFPLSVDPTTAEIIVKTPSGNKYVSILPSDAANTVLRTKVLSVITGNRVNIVEQDNRLQYKVEGNKVINFFDVYQYSIPVGVNLSASTGEILSIDAPVWYKVIGFFLT